MKSNIINNANEITIGHVIATTINENPGCSKVFIKSEIFFAYYGFRPSDSNRNWRRLWHGYFSETWDHMWKELDIGKWWLGTSGSEWVLDKVELGFSEGDLIECKGWKEYHWEIGIVMSTNRWGGVWLVIEGQPKYYNFRCQFRTFVK